MIFEKINTPIRYVVSSPSKIEIKWNNGLPMIFYDDKKIIEFTFTSESQRGLAPTEMIIYDDNCDITIMNNIILPRLFSLNNNKEIIIKRKYE